MQINCNIFRKILWNLAKKWTTIRHQIDLAPSSSINEDTTLSRDGSRKMNCGSMIQLSRAHPIYLFQAIPNPHSATKYSWKLGILRIANKILRMLREISGSSCKNLTVFSTPLTSEYFFWGALSDHPHRDAYIHVTNQFGCQKWH